MVNKCTLFIDNIQEVSCQLFKWLTVVIMFVIVF